MKTRFACHTKFKMLLHYLLIYNTATTDKTQPSTLTFSILDGSSGRDLSRLQPSNMRSLSLERQLMVPGRETKLFPLRFNVSNWANLQISIGIAPSPRLQSLRSIFLIEHNIDKGRNLISMEYDADEFTDSL
ncbi:hypothetical protein OWV82_013870 [Melia azedarach]|uniref:Uncharacterized protein n=1 Tax=Melia azedarach TaxID=155640 RepID=A0ACC1XVN9_MELAZ|nr:hypothetical protein OWV82_013870 [Melia azedarach]